MFIARVLFLFLLTFCIYSVMLSSWFKTMDDQFSIVNNRTVQHSEQWPQLFKEGYFRDHSYYRPLTNLSYGMEYKVWGLNPFYYNLDNLLLHIANAFLVWRLAALLVNAQAGFWAALLFAIHPVQWEAVSNISGRAILLSSFFSLWTIVAYARGRYLSAIIVFALGLLCKESTAVVPGLLLAHGLIYRRKITPLLWFVPIIAGYLYVRHHLGITEMFAWRNIHEAVIGCVTFLRSVLMYGRVLLLPFDMHFDRSMKLFDSVFIPAALATVVCWGLAVGVLACAWSKVNSLWRLTLAWVVLTLLPISQIVTTIGVQPGYISCAEHFLYLTCVMLFIAIVSVFYNMTRIRNMSPPSVSVGGPGMAIPGFPIEAFGNDILQGFSRSYVNTRIAALRLVLLGVLVFYALTTLEQNFYAQSELAMLERSLKIQPHNSRLNSSVGLIHALNGRFSKAEAYFRQAVADDPLNPRYLISLGKSICDQGRYEECLRVYNGVRNSGGYDKMLQENKNAALRLQQEQRLNGNSLTSK